MARRNTKQGIAVWKVFEAANRPLSPPEVLELAQIELPAMGIATVYRQIKQLTENDQLKKVEVAGQAPHYEIAGLAHHHHFVCDTCGKMYELEGCPVVLNKTVPPGFKVRQHDLTLFGVCADCGLG